MTFLSSRAIALILSIKVILICAILVYIDVLPNPVQLLVGQDSSWNVASCTREARQCSDGSYVGRVGPKCEFAECPTMNTRIKEIGVDVKNTPPGIPTPSDSSGGGEDSVIRNEETKPPVPVACTMEAKQCPDGSYVGRTGPRCEFEPCPSSNGNTTEIISVSGSVKIGPTCPVVQNPPDSTCADKPYNGAIILTNTSTGKKYFVITESNGIFTVSLTRGVYDVSRPENGSPFPSCGGKVEIVNPTTNIPISCDSGIR